MRPFVISLVALAIFAALTSAFQQEGEAEWLFSILVTGADQGILEPCGCAGGQLGGIAKRGTLLETDTYSTDALILATGGVAGGTDRLQVIRFEILLLCMDAMHYAAIGLGPEELALGLDRLRESREIVRYPFILTNVHYPEEAHLPFQPSLTKEVNGRRVRILAIIPESLEDRLPDGAKFIPPDQAIANAVEADPDADLTVVLLGGTREEAKALDPFLPDPKLIFYSYPHSEPRIFDFFKKDGIIRYLSPGDRGRYIISCRLRENHDGFLDPYGPVAEPIDLDPALESTEILEFMGWYRDMVVDENVLAKMVEVEPAPAGAPYVGNGTCALCHEQTFKTWKASGHARAWETLIRVKRDFDPECISCHVVGFGQKTGFKSEEESAYLLGVGCESCHGPSADHVASAGRVPTPLKVDCATCHTMDHSPEYDPKDYWTPIRCTPDGPYHLPDSKK